VAGVHFASRRAIPPAQSKQQKAPSGT